MTESGVDLAAHGGDVAAVAHAFGLPIDALLDFSANVNPLGPPRSLLDELARAAADPAELGRYPEPDARSLRRRIGAAIGVDPEAVVVANGAAALLHVVVRVALRRRCVLPLPAFSEDARALAGAGIEAVPVRLDPAHAFALDPATLVRAVVDAAADGILVTNPHNPSGALAGVATMRALVAESRRAGAITIVDEAFVDFAPEASVVAEAAHGEAIVLRSLTKFYAVPALRVGYAVAAPPLAARMRAALPSWPVGSLEMRALGEALGDEAFAERSRAAVAELRRPLAAGLAALGLRVFPSSANFLLIGLPDGWPDAPVLRRRAIETAGIVLRDASSYDGLRGAERYIRVAVRTEAENARLVEALSALAPRSDSPNETPPRR